MEVQHLICLFCLYFLMDSYIFVQSDSDKFREMQEDESRILSKVKFRDSVKKMKQKSSVSTNSIISVTDSSFI